ncbi:MAG: Rpn family recombination-promoting nuclease/putative transposase [Lachnospiraceae bacterium]|nr:Rpn family recombination-promoting nuclease/putative transposase [Lachnospiraceae bacterium]
MIPLIEHKSNVDYDVSMQLLRYMSIIWYEYKRERNEKKEGSSRKKSFRYPLILPIVYYEGSSNWTADLHLRDRISHWELASEFVPDFTYRVIRAHDYTNDELKNKDDEISLAILINKVQTVKDYTEFLESSRDFVKRIYANAPEDVQKIFQDILWALLMKMNVPTDEAQKMVKDMEADSMGYLFENMEKMDIQAERRNTMNARKEAEEAKKKAEEAEKKAEDAEKKAEDAEKKAEDAEKKAEDAKKKAHDAVAKAQDAVAKAQEDLEMLRKESDLIRVRADSKLNDTINQILIPLISQCQMEHLTREETIKKLRDVFKIPEANIFVAIDNYWK